MNTETKFLYMASILFLVLGSYNGIRFIANRNKVCSIEATIIDVKEAIPGMRKNNPAWANVTYNISGKAYYPLQKTQVPLGTILGEKIIVNYYRDNPDEIATFNYKNSIIPIIISIGCFVIGYLIRKKI